VATPETVCRASGLEPFYYPLYTSCHAPLKVAEVATQLFITNDKANCNGLVLAGSADFKTELSQSDMFDSRLQCKILKVNSMIRGSMSINSN
jgi:peptide subunit release factor 1 (eRF1)